MAGRDVDFGVSWTTMCGGLTKDFEVRQKETGRVNLEPM